MADPPRLQHVPMLDVLRAFAVGVVLLSHIWELAPGWIFREQMSDGGFLGVDLFFVLSGFLITALLLQEQRDNGRIALARFYGRRAVRLLPALVLLLGVFLVYGHFNDWPPFGNRTHAVESTWATLLYYMNWRVLFDPWGAADLTALWSLAIEEQFYLVWPITLMAFVGIRRRAGSVTAALTAAIVAITLWRLYVFHHWGWEHAYLRTDTRIDGLLVGALLASLYVRGLTPRSLPSWTPYAVIATWAAVLTTVEADRAWAYEGGITLWVLASAVMILYVVTTARPLRNPLALAAAGMGKVSYGIYLWQLPVIKAVDRWGEGLSEAEGVAAAFALLAACVTASWFLVERPAQKLRRWLTVRRTEAATGSRAARPAAVVD